VVARVEEDARAAGRPLPLALEALRLQRENAHLEVLSALKQAQGSVIATHACVRGRMSQLTA
jgi:hypothetical protein